MIRLVLLSLSLAVCQSEPCGSGSMVKCRCENTFTELLFTTSHQKLYGQWYTRINGFRGLCNPDEALDLWNNITGKHECRPTIPIPPIDRRPSESEMTRKGYERHGSSLYKFHIKTQDWENARRTCVSEGAHLAIINADEEAKLLENIFRRYPIVNKTMNNKFALIGFHDQFTEGNYITIYGEPIEEAGYAKWAIAEPNNNGKNLAGHPGEKCGSVNREGKLNDLPCWGRYPFFCELEDGDYPLASEINYMAAYYTGVETVIKPPPGKEKRQIPSSEYTLYPGVGFYKMHSRTETWENARRICESENAHLAIINSEQESAVLSVVFSKHKIIYDALWNDFAFIGFHDQYTEGQYLTIYNETLESTGFTKWWAASEPNNLGASDVDIGEDCGSVHRNGRLNDLPCHKRHAFICEQPLLV